MKYAAFFMCLLFAGQASALSCGSREAMATLLNSKGVEYVGQGIASNEKIIVELWVDPSSGKWTILHSNTDGTACQINIGKGWNQPPAFVPQPKPPEGKPT